MSESHKDLKSPYQELPLFTMPGFPDPFPENIIVTEHAKTVFEDARLSGSLDSDAKQLLSKGQGLIGISWIGKDEKNENVIYLDLIPAFNKDDKRPRLNKYDEDLNEYVYTDEPLGGNTGRNHEQFLRIIEKRIETAIEEKDENTLKMYEGLYTNTDGIITINKMKTMGFGVFKGDNNMLLADFRNKSANLNSQSIIYHPDYLLINYFKSDIDDIFQLEYYLKRCIPCPIANAFKQALLDQLPLESSKTERETLSAEYDNQPYEEKWDIVFKDNPEGRIYALLDTLYKCIDLRENKLELTKKIIQAIKRNIQEVTKDASEQKKLLHHWLNIPAFYNNKTPMMIAAINEKNSTIEYLLTEIGADTTIFEHAISNNNKELVNLLIQYSDAELKKEAWEIALKNKNIAIIETVLAESKMDPNLRLSTGELPLEYAIKTKNKDLVELLIHYGANPNAEIKMNSEMIKMMDYIDQSNDPELIQFFDKFKKEEKKEEPDSKDRYQLSSSLFTTFKKVSTVEPQQIEPSHYNAYLELKNDLIELKNLIQENKIQPPQLSGILMDKVFNFILQIDDKFLYDVYNIKKMEEGAERDHLLINKMLGIFKKDKVIPEDTKRTDFRNKVNFIDIMISNLEKLPPQNKNEKTRKHSV